MQIAQLVLEYIKALVWPGLIIFFSIRYRPYVERLLRRLTEETDQIESSFLGLTAKFRKELVSISSKPPTTADSTRIDLQGKLRQFAKDQFRILSSGFFTESLSGRMRLAKEVSELVMDLSIEDILEFAASVLPGERVAAGIGLRQHIKRDQSLLNSTPVAEAIARGLLDSQSRVRYRFVEVLNGAEHLPTRFQERLSEMSVNDDNDPVRNLARTVLRDATKRTAQPAARANRE